MEDLWADHAAHLQGLPQARLAAFDNLGILAGHVGVEAQALRRDGTSVGPMWRSAAQPVCCSTMHA